MTRHRAAIAIAAMLLPLPACGTGHGSELARHATPTNAPVPLVLLRSDGSRVAESEFRGSQSLLFVFATFDGMSQAALTPLSEFVERHTDVRVWGVLHEPNAQHFLAAWEEASHPPFTTTWERSGSLVDGRDSFEPVTTIPTYLLLDARGHEVSRHAGYLGVDDLEVFYESPIDTATH